MGLVHEAACARALLAARDEPRLPRDAHHPARAHRRRRRRRRRLSLVPQQGPRVPSARGLRRVERRRARAGPRADAGAERGARRPRHPARQQADLGVLVQLRLRAGRRGCRGWRRLSLRRLSRRAAVLLEDPTLAAAAARAYAAVAVAHAATLDRAVGAPVRLQPRGRAQRAAAVGALAAPVLGGHRRHRRRRARTTSRRSGAGDVAAVRHGRLVAVRARRRVRDEGVPAVRHAAAREARGEDAGPVLGRRVAALPRLLLRPAGRDARTRRRRRSIRSRSTASSTSRRSRSRCRRTRPSRSRSAARCRRSGSRAVRTRPDVDASRRHRPGDVSRADRGDEPRRTSHDRQARAGRRRRGRRAGGRRAARARPARLAGNRSRHAVARAPCRLHRPDRRQPAADRRSGRPSRSAEARRSPFRWARGRQRSWRRTRPGSRRRSISESLQR